MVNPGPSGYFYSCGLDKNAWWTWRAYSHEQLVVIGGELKLDWIEEQEVLSALESQNQQSLLVVIRSPGVKKF